MRWRDGRVEIAVSDIGIGMDEEQARRCFDKFWQAESTDVRRFGGTGIGLYIVSSLVDAMGGTITVDTAVGRGSTFIVTLPSMTVPDDAAGARNEPLQLQRVPPIEWQTHDAFLADDFLQCPRPGIHL